MNYYLTVKIISETKGLIRVIYMAREAFTLMAFAWFQFSNHAEYFVLAIVRVAFVLNCILPLAKSVCVCVPLVNAFIFGTGPFASEKASQGKPKQTHFARQKASVVFLQ